MGMTASQMEEAAAKKAAKEMAESEKTVEVTKDCSDCDCESDEPTTEKID